MESKVCDGCHNKKHVNFTNNRLVTESCGHLKCMDCLLREKSGCLACVREKHSNADCKQTNVGHIADGKSAQTERNEAGDVFRNGDVEKSIPAEINENGQSKENEMTKHKTDTTHIIELDSGGFLCMECNRNFNARSQVPYHAYCNGTPKPFKCTECDKSFVSASHFKYHMRVHRNEREFACDACGERFFQRSKLQRHKLKHTKEKRYLCSSCPKAFEDSAALRRHRLTHTRDRPYQCKLCATSLRDPSNYNKHMQRHKEAGKKEKCGQCSSVSLSRGRAHQCTRCAGAFHSSKDLRRHAAVHTDSKPFRCKVCNRRFRRKDNLERHVRNTHSDIAIATAIEKDDDETVTTDNIETTSSVPERTANDMTEKHKLEILNPLPPLPEEVIQKHLNSEQRITNDVIDKNKPQEVIQKYLQSEKNPNKSVIMDKSYILEANTARQTVIVSKNIERKVPSPVQEYVHKMRKAKSMRGQKDLMLPPIDEKKLHDFLEIESNLHQEVGAPHPKNLQIYKNILGLGDSGKSKDDEQIVQKSSPEMHWRKKKLNINW